MYNTFKLVLKYALVLGGLTPSFTYAAVTDLANAPLTNGSGSVVRPNMMFILDDSGSMDFNYMPDYIGRGSSDQDNKCKAHRRGSDTRTDCNGAIDNGSTPNEGGDPPFYSYRFNSLYYNPNVLYTPPVSPCNAAQSLPSMTAANTSNWTQVRNKGHEIDTSCNQTSSTINLTTGYPELVYCTADDSSPTSSACKRNGMDQAVTDFLGSYDYPDGTTNGNYRYPRTRNGEPHYYEITPREYCKSSALNDCSATSSATYPVPAYVRFCNTSSNRTFASANTDSLLNNVCQAKFSPTSQNASNYVIARYGNFSRVDIVATNTSYPKASTRTDCAGTTCTYEEEMTNFANWYAYYRTRMQLMKSAAGRAFGSVDSSYRVGFITINPDSPVNTDKYLAISDFNTAQKESWYKKLYSQNPSGGTPLREALSRVGRHFAGKTDAINSGMTGDPVQYSCQQNFAILTTDGYWNGNSGVQLDGTTAIGNQDNVDSGYSTRSSGAYDGNVSGASNTLADVALYYYKTDLRTAFADSVPTTNKDSAPHQHMTLFTLGLGLDGQLTYRSDYESATAGDFYAIKTGDSNWPKPEADSQTALDDLWHAAVNGRGLYFSAKDPASLTSGVQGALTGVTSRTGAAAASATSSPNITETDNYIYSSTYRTLYWDGEIVAQTIDTQTGAVSSTNVWSAQANLDGKVSAASDTRTIYKFDTSATNKIEAFTWATLDSTEQSYFNNKCSVMSQCSSLDSSTQTAADSGSNLVSFLRGQSGLEGTTAQTDKAYRDRDHVLGDTVNATPAFVKAPRFNFNDNVTPTYSAFKTSNASRQGMLYVAGNDGMLHALNADSGVETWAYVPKLVMPNLYKLADKNYSANHQYFVDGSPQVLDVYDTTTSTWKTILVGGLNGGGRGYYALDITTPSSPKALWEFCYDSSFCPVSDSDLGYTYGNAVITKLPTGNVNAGKWVVIVTSGYNNVSPGNGKGYLYILDAITGAVLEKVATNVGSAVTPSGLAKIGAWSENADLDPTATDIYGGDLLGNLWRFKLGQNPVSAFHMTTLVNGTGVIQPITTKPELGKTSQVADHIVYVGTGSYLGASDIGNTTVQSIYAIRDNNITYDNRSLTARTITQTGTTASISGNSVDWANGGWYVDLPASGERVNIDPQLVLGTLVIASNIPASNACSVGGTSWVYQFDYTTGLAVSGSSSFGQKQQSGVTVGIVIFRLPTGQLKAVITDAGGGKVTVPVQTNPGSTQSRRAGWRELVK